MMRQSDFISKIISSSSELEDVLKLRMEVFVVEQGVTAEEEIDGLDTLQAIESGHVIHIMVVGNQGLVGTARLILEGSNPNSDLVLDFPHIGRVAVKKCMRRQGIGEILMGELHVIAKNMNFGGVTLSAQIQAAPFYTRLGYIKRGNIYDDVGIPHQDMMLANLTSVSPRIIDEVFLLFASHQLSPYLHCFHFQ